MPAEKADRSNMFIITSTDDSSFDTPSAAQSPIASPTAHNRSDYLTIISTIRPALAPSAMRTPISCVRRATAYDSRP